MQPETILKDCLKGRPLGRSEAHLLSSVQGDGVTALLGAASELRDCHKGKTITFSPKIFIPLTNLCRDFCGYCTFRKAPGEPGAKI
ncbi:MAG: 7,8-didemethyl-8-hydroxy-5-deazariboflavin synthase subunit CofG, partial [Candidatus Binatia bacterium]